ncbi:MAG: nucleotidyltransferase family protein [Parafilimonas sp.]
MTKEAVIEILKKHKPIMQKKYGLTELALFGSYSRNEQNDNSDIDLLVDFNLAPGLNYFDMLYEFDDLFENEVQIISKKAIKPKYLTAIQEDLIYV